jgi:hypothetical protein
MGENRLALLAPRVVGGLLVLESLGIMFLAVFAAIVGSLAGALAFGVSGGSATNEQVAQAAVVMAITLASPFVVAGVIAVGGVLLLLRRRRGVVITVGVFAVVAQIAFHHFFAEGFHVAELVPCAVNLLAIAVAFAFVPAPAATSAPA